MHFCKSVIFFGFIYIFGNITIESILLLVKTISKFMFVIYHNILVLIFATFKEMGQERNARIVNTTVFFIDSRTIHISLTQNVNKLFNIIIYRQTH